MLLSRHTRRRTFIAALTAIGWPNTFLGPELVPKRLAYLKELLPSISRVHVLWHPNAYAKQTMDDMVAETEHAAATLNLHLQFVAAGGPSEFEKTFQAVANGRPGRSSRSQAKCSLRPGRSSFGSPRFIAYRRCGMRENLSSLVGSSCTERA